MSKLQKLKNFIKIKTPKEIKKAPSQADPEP